MKSKFDRKAWDKDVAEEQKENYERREDSGLYKSIINDSVPRTKIIKKFLPGEHQVNIVAFQVGKNHPTKEEGKIAYSLEVHSHQGIGPTKDNWVCLARTYKKPCAICDYQQQLREEEADEDKINALYPKRRMLYNLEVLDSPKEQAKGVQLFEIAHFSFTKPLEEQAKLPAGGGLVHYAATSAGKIVTFNVSEGTFKDKKTGKTGKKSDYTSFHFLDRDPLADEIFEQAFILDDVIHIPTYEEVYEALHQEKMDSSDHEDTHKEERQEDDVPDYHEETKDEEVVPTECIFDGVVFGESFDEFEDCNACEIRVYCEAKKEEIETAKKPIAKTPAPKAKEPVKPEPRKRPGR